MAGEGLVYLFVLIVAWFIMFVLIPIGIGTYLLLRFKKRRNKEVKGLEPKSKYRGKILLGAGVALIGFGVFVITAQLVLAEMDRQRIEDIANRPPPSDPNDSGKQEGPSNIQSIAFNFYSNETHCCIVGLKLHPDAKHDGVASIEFIRHIPGCSETRQDHCPEQDRVLHIIDFQTFENDSRYFDDRAAEYRYPLSEADFQVLNQTGQYDLVLTYSPIENDVVHSQRLWNQTVYVDS